MKKLLFLFLIISQYSIAQISGSCTTCPPSGVGNTGKVLTSNGSKKAVWGTAGSSSPFATLNNSDFQIDTTHKFFVGTIDTHSHVMIAHYFDSIHNTASFHIDDTLFGEIYIPHWSAGFGSLDNKFSGIFGFAESDTSLNVDFGWKNFENDESRHIKNI